MMSDDFTTGVYSNKASNAESKNSIDLNYSCTTPELPRYSLLHRNSVLRTPYSLLPTPYSLIILEYRRYVTQKTGKRPTVPAESTFPHRPSLFVLGPPYSLSPEPLYFFFFSSVKYLLAFCVHLHSLSLKYRLIVA